MRFTTLKSEDSVGALADRFYANLNAKSRKLAEAALLKANPQLARSNGFKPGTVVNVPEVPGLKVKSATTGQDPVDDLLTGLSAAVSGYREHLAKGLEAMKSDMGTQRDLLKDKGVARVLKSEPGAAELARSLAELLLQRDKDIPEAQQQQDAVFEQIGKDIDSFRG